MKKTSKITLIENDFGKIYFTDEKNMKSSKSHKTANSNHESKSTFTHILKTTKRHIFKQQTVTT